METGRMTPAVPWMNSSMAGHDESSAITGMKGIVNAAKRSRGERFFASLMHWPTCALEGRRSKRARRVGGAAEQVGTGERRQRAVARCRCSFGVPPQQVGGIAVGWRFCAASSSISLAAVAPW
eukprot:1737923-Prymnesium_polylepis.1